MRTNMGHGYTLQLFFICLTVVHCAHGILTEKPDFIHTCFKQDKDFEKCSTQAVQNLFYKIVEGIPALNLAPLDPLQVDKVGILQGEGPVSVDASLRNVTITGFAQTNVLSNRIDLKKYDFYTKIFLPRLRIDGRYNLRGRILVIPIVGRGQCWFDAKDLEIFVKSDVKLQKRDGFHFFNVTKCHVKFSINGLKLHMGNLFDGIKALEDSTNAYLNANWRPVAESLNPILSKTIADIMIKIMKKIFDNIPADFFVGDID